MPFLVQNSDLQAKPHGNNSMHSLLVSRHLASSHAKVRSEQLPQKEERATYTLRCSKSGAGDEMRMEIRRRSMPLWQAISAQIQQVRPAANLMYGHSLPF